MPEHTQRWCLCPFLQLFVSCCRKCQAENSGCGSCPGGLGLGWHILWTPTTARATVGCSDLGRAGVQALNTYTWSHPHPVLSDAHDSLIVQKRKVGTGVTWWPWAPELRRKGACSLHSESPSINGIIAQTDVPPQGAPQGHGFPRLLLAQRRGPTWWVGWIQMLVPFPVI